MSETITIPKKEYERLKKIEEDDIELAKDIAMGIRDVLTGKIREI